jgi:AcrR family transcriptional regulator
MCDYVLRFGTGVNNQSPRIGSEPNATRQVFGNTGRTMSAEPTDRRVRRTQDLLRRALLALIQEKGYDRITVQDILDRADIGRSTFYGHYRDKDDLLRAGFEDIRAEFAAERDAAEKGTRSNVEFLEPVHAVFDHVGRHRQFWGPLSRKGGADLVTRILRESVSDLAREHLRSQFPDATADPTRREAAIQFVTGACMGLLIWWLENDAVPYTAEEIQSIFRQLATQGVKRFLAT